MIITSELRELRAALILVGFELTDSQLDLFLRTQKIWSEKGSNLTLMDIKYVQLTWKKEWEEYNSKIKTESQLSISSVLFNIPCSNSKLHNLLVRYKAIYGDVLITGVEKIKFLKCRGGGPVIWTQFLEYLEEVNEKIQNKKT